MNISVKPVIYVEIESGYVFAEIRSLVGCDIVSLRAVKKMVQSERVDQSTKDIFNVAIQLAETSGIENCDVMFQRVCG